MLQLMGMKTKIKSLIIILQLSVFSYGLNAQTELPSQSSARPFGLDIVGSVNQAGSDKRSADFQENSLPVLQDFLNQKLDERLSLDDVSGIALDPSKLRLNTDSDVRVYFIGEGAGYHNTLGFTTEGFDNGIKNSELIFPDASSYDSAYKDGSETLGKRNSSYPLLPGDFVDLGNFEGGTLLDFFLIANGVNGGTNVWTGYESENRDGIQHVVSFALPDSPYLLIGFEDLYGGGDRDFNDLLIAVDIGSANISHLANPEPSTFLMLGLFAGSILYLNKRNSQSTAN